MSTPETFTKFVGAGGVGPTPQPLLDAVAASQAGNATYEMDLMVGSTAVTPDMITLSPNYCGQDEFKRTLYCACVNNSLPCPLQSSPYCKSAYAYKPYAYSHGAMLDNCKLDVLCNNSVIVNGNQNVDSELTQCCSNSDCRNGGTTGSSGTSWPWSYILLFVLIVILVITLAVNFEVESLLNLRSAGN
jgi:hypothetical protein